MPCHNRQGLICIYMSISRKGKASTYIPDARPSFAVQADGKMGQDGVGWDERKVIRMVLRGGWERREV